MNQSDSGLVSKSEPEPVEMSSTDAKKKTTQKENQNFLKLLKNGTMVNSGPKSAMLNCNLMFMMM